MGYTNAMTKGLIIGLATLCLCSTASAFSFGTDKFKEEVDKETSAVKLTREVQQGGYGIVTTAELKSMIDSGKDMLIIDSYNFV